MRPTTVAASVEGGIGTYFIRGPKTCYIKFRNNGQCVLGMYSNNGQPVTIKEFQDSHDNCLQALKSISLYFDYNEQREETRLNDLARYSNPWTVEIQNTASGGWQNFCYLAPLTLKDAEEWQKVHAEQSPGAIFRVVPWFNSMQLQYVWAEREQLQCALTTCIRTLKALLTDQGQAHRNEIEAAIVKATNSAHD